MKQYDSSHVEVEVFSTCPQSSAVAGGADYLERVVDVARWSEAEGLAGILVYTDNSLVDPWLVSQTIVQNTSRLCPLVAVQPVYMHPYTAAKIVASLGHLYGRRVYLNMVAGGFKNDLNALDDPTPHDKRYDRLVEYTRIVTKLLAGGPVTYEGDFYRLTGLKLAPQLAPELQPGIFVSGSSQAGLGAARQLGATGIMYPKPPGEDDGAHRELASAGVRVGIVTRESEQEAWRVAHERFPEDRKGQLAHQLAMKVSDSLWHKQLSGLDDANLGAASTYWLVPFKNYKTFCPYLVGSYERVAHELTRYIDLGFRTFILDIPPDEVELRHIGAVFRAARRRAA